MHALPQPHPTWVVLIIIPVVILASNQCNNGAISETIKEETWNETLYPEGTHWKEGDNYIVCFCDQVPCNFTEAKDEVLSKTPTLGSSSPPQSSTEEDAVDGPKETTSGFTDFYTSSENTTTRYNSTGVPNDFEMNITTVEDTEEIPSGEAVTTSTPRPKTTISYIAPPKPNERKEQTSVLIGVGIVHLISIVSLIFLLYAYQKIDEMKFLRGKCIKCLATCLLIYSIGMFPECMGLQPSSKLPCPVFGILAYFGSICLFFWLNVMCFDAFLIGFNSEYFKDMPVTTKFTNFSIYCWPLSILLSLLVLIMSIVLNKDDIMSPGIGTLRCSLKPSNTGTFIYYHVIVMFTMVSNIIFFIYTKQVFRKTDDTGFESQKRKLMTYAKLLFVLGFIWILEFIEWLSRSSDSNTGFTMLIQFLNAARGFFVLTACFFTNERALNLFQKKRKPNLMDLDDAENKPDDGGETGEDNAIELKSFKTKSVHVGNRMTRLESCENSSEGLLSIGEEDEEDKEKGSKDKLLNENEITEGVKEPACIGDLDELLTLGEALKTAEDCKLESVDIANPEFKQEKAESDDLTPKEQENNATETMVDTVKGNDDKSADIEKSAIVADIEKIEADQVSPTSVEAASEKEDTSESNNSNKELPTEPTDSDATEKMKVDSQVAPSKDEVVDEIEL